jgi:hypothetical protein
MSETTVADVVDESDAAPVRQGCAAVIIAFAAPRTEQHVAVVAVVTVDTGAAAIIGAHIDVGVLDVSPGLGAVRPAGPRVARRPRAVPGRLSHISVVAHGARERSELAQYPVPTDDAFADGTAASAARDREQATLAREVVSGPRHADGPAALLTPVPKVALFFSSA